MTALAPKSEAAPNLASLGNPAADYVHRDKFVEPGEAIRLPGAILKWYDLAQSDTPVDPEVRSLARAFVERECMARTPELAGGLGFAVLHRCGADFYFLLISTWRNENELWESVYSKDSAAHPEFRTFTFAGAHRGTYCVWELGVAWHEQQAWKRYLLSARDEAAKRAYLADRFRGPV
jgi:hypothetical protein